MGDSFQEVRKKHRAKVERIKCSKPGCDGSCPRNVIERGLAAGGVPAVCQTCDRRYKLVPGNSKPGAGGGGGPKAGGGGGVGPKAGGGGAGGGDSKAFQTLQKQVAQLQAQLEGKTAASDSAWKAGSSGGGSEDQDMGDSPTAAAKAKCQEIRARIKAYKEMPEILRHCLAPLGGHEKVLADAQAELQAAGAAQRGALPIADRKAQAENFLKSQTAIAQRLEKEEAMLQQQRDELDKKLADKKAAMDGVAAKIAQAKAELAGIAEQKAAELRGAQPEKEAAAAAASGAAAAAPPQLPEHLVEQCRELFKLIPREAGAEAEATAQAALAEMAAFATSQRSAGGGKTEAGPGAGGAAPPQTQGPGAGKGGIQAADNQGGSAGFRLSEAEFIGMLPESMDVEARDALLAKINEAKRQRVSR